MENFKLLIVEDNPGYALELEMMVKKAGYDLVGPVDNSEDAIQMVKKEKPDLVIMDIDINGKKNGVQVAKEIKPENVPVIFITSIVDKDVYDESKEALRYAYLVKPFDMLTLQSSIEVSLRSLNAKQPKKSGDSEEWEEDMIIKGNFLIKNKGIFKKVRSEEIVFIESDWNYCILNLKDRKFAVKMSLRKILEKLGMEKFVPIHKRYLVQFEKIDAIDTSTNKVILGETSLPLGRTFKEALLRRFEMLK